jgi:hypothetical protein
MFTEINSGRFWLVRVSLARSFALLLVKFAIE